MNARNAGATPPGIYEMKPREKLFHGVPALRMTPVDGSDTFGRVGLLVHSYMLGPNGDSTAASRSSTTTNSCRPIAAARSGAFAVDQHQGRQVGLDPRSVEFLNPHAGTAACQPLLQFVSWSPARIAPGEVP